MNTDEISDQEKSVMRRLKSLGKVWAASLWLWSANGELYVMRYKKNGERAMTAGGVVNQDYIVGQIHGIDNDGGDW